MSVRDNLMMGAFTRTDKAGIAQTLESVLARFPRLKERYSQQASTLSRRRAADDGDRPRADGQAAAAAARRALARRGAQAGAGHRPLDRRHQQAKRRSRVLLVEQNSRMALRISQRAYALTTGSIALSRQLGRAAQRRARQGALSRRRSLMRLLVVNPNTTALDDRKDRRRGARRRRRRAPRSSRSIRSPGRPASRAITTRCSPIPGLIAEMQKAGRGRCHDHRLLRRHRARCRAQLLRRAGDRHRRGGVPPGEPDRRQVLGGDDAGALGAGDRAQPRPLRPDAAAAPGCGRPTSRCSSSKSPARPARGRISREIDRAIQEDHAEAIVLGCAGMADLAAELSREHGLPVIDGVAAAVKLRRVPLRARPQDQQAAAAMLPRARSSTLATCRSFHPGPSDDWRALSSCRPSSR